MLKFKYGDSVEVVNDSFYTGTFGTIMKFNNKAEGEVDYLIRTHKLDQEIWVNGKHLKKDE